MNDPKFLKFYQLHLMHYNECQQYRHLVDNIFGNTNISDLRELPFLPSTIFKRLALKSVPDEKVYKTMMSSGTAGQERSKIYLDKDNAVAQQKALISIVGSALESSRAPMLILDSMSQIKNRSSFTARGAGILGFMMFGTKRYFALDESVNIDIESMIQFADVKTAKNKLLYGFTSIIWEEILKKLKQNQAILGDQPAVLIHGGGWKKLANQNILPTTFINEVKSKLGKNVKVIDYYGMVEQTGSIFLGCEDGYLHTNQYNDVIIRDPETFEVLRNGELGVVQVLSTLPRAYPGHSILTEDLGYIVSENIKNSGISEKSFIIEGRIPKTEIRGCSNTYER